MNTKKKGYKAYLKAKKALRKNWEAQRALGYVELDKPIHDGYDVKWVLRDDIARRDDADVFEHILEEFGESAWCRDGKFLSYDRAQRKYVEIKPYIKNISGDIYDKYMPIVQKHFVHDPSKDRYGYWGHVRKSYECTIPEWHFKKEVEKSFITHRVVHDEILKQEEAEIEAYIERNHYNLDKWKYKVDAKFYHRSDRRHNKQALKKNLSFIEAKYDDINDDWDSWAGGWCNDLVEFRYNHRNNGKWESW